MIDIKRNGAVWNICTANNNVPMPTGSCSVFWRLVGFALGVTLLAVLAAAVLGFLGTLSGQLVAAIMTGTLLKGSLIMIVSVVLLWASIVGSLVSAIYFSYIGLNEGSKRARKSETLRNISKSEAVQIIKAAYKSHKEKFCENNINIVD